MTNDELYRDILGFIGRFSTDGYHYRNQVLECFLRGNCYWFAYILSIRFAEYSPLIMLDLEARHFGCEIDGKVYDIVGDATDAFAWQPWDAYRGNDRDLIAEQCIMF